MIADLHNLLPRSTKRALRIQYYLRVVTVLGFLLAASIVAGTVALVPAYVVLSSTEETLNTELNDLRAALEWEGVDADTLKEMKMLVEGLSAYSASMVSEQLQTVNLQRGNGVLLTSYVFDVPGRSIVIEGHANTRDALVAFVDVLERDPMIKKATLPITSLAMRTDVNFEITLELADPVVPNTP